MRAIFGSVSIGLRLLLLSLGAVLPIICFSTFVAVRSIESEDSAVERSLRASVRALAIDVEREIANVVRTGLLLRSALDQTPSDHGGGLAAVAAEATKLGLIVTLEPGGASSDAGEIPPAVAGTASVAQPGSVEVQTTGDQSSSQPVRVTVKFPVQAGEADRKVLTVAFAADKFQQIAAEQRLPKRWIDAIVDTTGRVIARSQDPQKYIGRSARQEFLTKATGSDGVITTESLEGIPAVNAYVRLPEVGWIVAVAAPKHVISSPWRQSMLLLAVGAVGSLLIAGAAALVAARTIAPPVLGLARAARALGAGQMPPTPPSGLREADEVGAALRDAFVEIDKREADLVRSEERYRRIFELSPLGIMLATEERRVISANPALYRLLGYEAGELIGQDIAIFTHPDDRTTRAFNDTTEPGRRTVEKRFVHKDGAIIHVRLNVELYRLPEGPPQFLILVEDVTSRTVAERARDKAEERLRHVEKIEALGRLTGGIAHDFNNLLLAISLNLEGLDGELDGSSAERLGEAVHAATLARTLTGQLLAFSRSQSLDPASIDVADTLNAAARMLRRALPPSIEVSVRCHRDLWPVFADRHQFETALLNLALNARDAMQAGGKLMFEAENTVLDEIYRAENPDVQPGEYVMIAVSDTGEGMSAEVLERAFEPFFSTKPTGEGTGLGLSQVHGFVRQSGGHVKIYSEPGRGTTVKLFLGRGSNAAEMRPPERGAPVLAGSGTILLVEDTAAVRNAVRRVLRDHGFAVIDVDTGQEALAILRSAQPLDLLFTDMVLPGPIGGAELAAAAAQLRPGLRVLLTSGFTATKVANLTARRDGVDMISKPYAMQALLERINALLGTQV